MAAVTLVMIFCLAGSDCETVREPQPNAMTCFISAQELAVDWLGDHPGFELHSWRCEEPSA